MSDEARTDDLLAGVAARDARPDDAVLARFEATARAMQPRQVPSRPGLFDLLGGWLGLGGLATATAAGLWLGIAPPEALSPVLGSPVTLELLPDTLAILEEG